MGGAVSLGAFEGGVVYELLEVLEAHNHAHPDRRIEIDILVGASAGSMTLAMLANHLYGHADSCRLADNGQPAYRTPVQQSPFYTAWVDSIYFQKLLPERRKFGKDPFLFSSHPIESIAKALIPVWYAGRQPLCVAPEQLVLAMTLANMEGFEYRIPYQQGLQEFTKLHMEERLFVVTAGQGNLQIQVADANGDSLDGSGWDEVRETAIASGSYPFAFAPRPLSRSRVEFGHDKPVRFSQQPPLDKTTANYVDGGTFNNEPLHAATRIAQWKDRNDPGVQRRFVILTPEIRSQSSELADRGAGLADLAQRKYLTDLGAYVSTLSDMILKTSSSFDRQNYLKARAETKARLSRLVQAVVELDRSGTETVRAAIRGADYLHHSGTVTDQMQTLVRVGQLLPEPADLLATGIPEVAAWRGSAMQRRIAVAAGQEPQLLAAVEVAEEAYAADADEALAAQFSTLRNASTEARHLFLRLFELLGFARDESFVVISSAIDGGEPVPLLGTRLRNFGGFFNRRFRVHDFAVGRYAAQQALARDLGVEVPEAWRQEVERLKEEQAAYASSLDTPLTFAGHFESERDKQYFRERVDERLDGYTYSLSAKFNPFKPLLANAVYRIADRRFDRWVWETPDKPNLTVFMTTKGIGRSLAVSYLHPLPWRQVYLDVLGGLAAGDLGSGHVDAGPVWDVPIGRSDAVARLLVGGGIRRGFGATPEHLALADLGGPTGGYASIGLRVFILKLQTRVRLFTPGSWTDRKGNSGNVDLWDRVELDAGVEVAHAQGPLGMATGIPVWAWNLIKASRAWLAK